MLVFEGLGNQNLLFNFVSLHLRRCLAVVFKELWFVRWGVLGLVRLLIHGAAERRLGPSYFLISMFRLAIVTVIALA